jgi:glucosamine--fructose-6-phosphate aminotransferase (isomerizing)
MCGIVGYVGYRPASEVVVDGLRRLEYRGYDSAGIAVVAADSLHVTKKAGKLANLDKALADDPAPESSAGIGHTRWATHGAPNDANAHPHTDCKGSVAVIHNGIIENFAVLRAEVAEAGHELLSETDTEAVAHLLEIALPEHGNDLAEAMRAVCRRRPWSPRAAAHRWSSAAARARTSSPRTSPPSSPTPATPSSSVRIRSWW